MTHQCERPCAWCLTTFSQSRVGATQSKPMRVARFTPACAPASSLAPARWPRPTRHQARVVEGEGEALGRTEAPAAVLAGALGWPCPGTNVTRGTHDTRPRTATPAGAGGREVLLWGVSRRLGRRPSPGPMITSADAIVKTLAVLRLRWCEGVACPEAATSPRGGRTTSKRCERTQDEPAVQRHFRTHTRWW